MIKINFSEMFFRSHAALARIAAVTPQLRMKASGSHGSGEGAMAKGRREEYEQRAGSSS
ncbi:hypothetical protein [Chryseobacterium sp. SN22]|uniref:hypothetical protein n=1 Tax=Chryseobacterium sp. SN22 TaxID=2606431 RepID=UPI001627FCD7|nr:hypothetical protein [Chryseobacterium sp. SN22]